MRPARKPIAFSQRLFFASFSNGAPVRWGSTHLLGSSEPLRPSLRTSGTIAAPVKQGGDRGASGFFGGPEGRNRREAPPRVYITGMFIALGAILMFFAALVSAWVVRREQLPPGEQLTCKEKHAQNRRHTPPMAMLGIPVDN